MQKIKDYLPLAIKYLLFAIALTPLIYTNKTFYPFILTKTVFFRGLVEIALFSFLLYLALKIFYKEPLSFSKFANFLKNPLLVLLGLLFISIILSTIFAIDKYTAFWGSLERGGGFWGEIHYYIFLALTVAIFSKKDWSVFFKISSVVGLFMIFYGFLQYFNVVEWPFALEGQPRPGSFAGNSSFFGAYLFFVLAFSIFLLFLEKKVFWRILGIFNIILALAMIFLTATRGAILGLIFGLFVLLIFLAFSKNQSGDVRSKNFSRGLLILFILFLIFFWITRTNPFWQNIQGFNRLARPALLDPKDGSVQTRLMAWQSGFEAFKARPLFGWGMDNYFLAWNKYYNPENSFSGETWLDRAHNKLIDVLVMQGLFGLAAYLGLYFFLLYLVFKKKPFNGASPFVGAILVSYFIQNLFLFDETNSYLFFFAITGFLISIQREKESEPAIGRGLEDTNKIQKIPGIKKTLFYIFSLGFCVLILYCIYFYSYIPYKQGRDIQLARGGQKDFVKAQLIKSFYPYNFVQPSIRGYITDFYYAERPYIFENDDFKMLQDLVLASIDEVIASGPRDPRFYIRKSQILDVMGRKNPQLYEESEKAVREALELSPHRQEIMYPLALSLAKQGKLEEALALIRKTIELSPNVARPHFYLGLLLSVQDIQKNQAEILSEFSKVVELNPSLENLREEDAKQMAEIYFKLQEYERLVQLVMGKVNGITNKNFEPKYYELALRYYLALKDAPNFIKVANFVGKQFPNLKENMDGLANLAREGAWGILDKLP